MKHREHNPNFVRGQKPEAQEEPILQVPTEQGTVLFRASPDLFPHIHPSLGPALFRTLIEIYFKEPKPRPSLRQFAENGVT